MRSLPLLLLFQLRILIVLVLRIDDEAVWAFFSPTWSIPKRVMAVGIRRWSSSLWSSLWSSSSSSPSWSDLEGMLVNHDGISLFDTSSAPAPPLCIDSALQETENPIFSTDRPTLFRERHGWCPYSERVWLMLEYCDARYDTILIENSGFGGRPSYYSGQTPQMRWPDDDDGRTQGESMDLVYEVRSRFGSGGDDDQNDENDEDVAHVIGEFRRIFPRARPSSRAAFLFQYNGDPLSRGTFEETLSKTDELLSRSRNRSRNGGGGEEGGIGPFFCGSRLTAADVAWAPFLERYRYQLPCLHEGLRPYDERAYPHLTGWYRAMDSIPSYACRVRGDASSWRKVLTMAGFGNAGVPPPQIEANMMDAAEREWKDAAAERPGAASVRQRLWDDYASTRLHLASTPHAEAGATIVRNRNAILRDALKRAPTWRNAKNGGNKHNVRLPTTEDGIDEAMRDLARVLIEGDWDATTKPAAAVAMAAFLDDRMCVPRDMGSMSAAAIKRITSLGM